MVGYGDEQLLPRCLHRQGYLGIGPGVLYRVVDDIVYHLPDALAIDFYPG